MKCLPHDFESVCRGYANQRTGRALRIKQNHQLISGVIAAGSRTALGLRIQ